MNPATPGQRLRILREHLGKSASALAEALGRSKSVWSYYESGRSPLPRSTAMALEAAYGIRADWLLEGTGEMWCTPAPTPMAVKDGQQMVPILPGDPAFNQDGDLILPRDPSSWIGLPTALIHEAVRRCGGGMPEEACFIKARDASMAPTIHPGDLALVCFSEKARCTWVNHALYLVALTKGAPAMIRRVARDPMSGGLVIAQDAPEHVSLKLDPMEEDLYEVIKARVCWLVRTSI